MSRRVTGFTLAELLVALAVTGLVIVAAHAALATLGDAATRARTARQPVLAGAATRAMLEGWLRSATLADGSGPFWGADRSEGREAMDELVFSVMDGGALHPGPQRIRIWVDRDPLNALQGVLAEVRPLPGRYSAPPETLAIAPSATGLSIRYLVLIDGRERWLDEWQSSTLLPRVAEVSFSRYSRVRLGESGLDDLPPLLTLPLRVPVGVEGL